MCKFPFKTKFILNFTIEDTITVNGYGIKTVKECKYLEHTINVKESAHKEVMRRFEAEWSSFGIQRNKNKKIWRKKYLTNVCCQK